MVSTRGLKCKFTEGEKVLCYEPDPTKAKVLYESKVKDVVVNREVRGKKAIEYLIHFRGWNSSWDRCVSEEFILKDTVENRQLQKDLAEKSKLQFGSYLYRRERKKHNQKLSERINQSSEDGSCGSPNDEEDEQNGSSSSEDSSVEDDSIPLELTEELKELLEVDYRMIHEQNKLHKLPSEPNVINILESYWKHYANNQKCGGLNEKNATQHRFRTGFGGNGQKFKPEVVQRNISICQEVLDGIRIYFDFYLPDLLLYNGERGQVDFTQAKFLPLGKIKLETVKNEPVVQEYAHLPNIDEEDYLQSDCEMQRPASRRRTLRSYRSTDTNSNGSLHSENSSTKGVNGCVDLLNPVLRIPIWKALPDYVYLQQPPPPSLIYGATHLARLFVKLPELLNTANMADDKLKSLLRHAETFMDFLGDRKEWFGERFYADTA